MIGDLWPYLIAVLVAIGGFFGIRQAGKSAGREQVRRQQEADAAKMREKARQVERESDAKDMDTIRRDAAGWVRDRADR